MYCKISHVAQKLRAYALAEFEDTPELKELVPDWHEYLPQARVALQAAAEWNAEHDQAGPRG